MRLPPLQNAYVITDRKSEEPVNDEEKESKIAPGKIVNNQNQKPQTSHQVSETDLYLLSAIEKLVYRVDFMEKRLRRVEEMLYYVSAGNRVDQGNSTIEVCSFRKVIFLYVFRTMPG